MNMDNSSTTSLFGFEINPQSENNFTQLITNHMNTDFLNDDGRQADLDFLDEIIENEEENLGS